MKKELRQLLVERYKWLMLGIAALLIFIAAQGTLSTVSQWHSMADDLDKTENEAQFYKDLKDESMSVDGKMFIYYDDKTDKEVGTDDYDVYKDYQLKVFDGNFYGFNTYSESSLVLLTIAIICGFTLFFYDNKTNFNTLLFSSRFKRKDIYQMKYLLIGSTFILSLAISRLIYVLGLIISIPSNYLNATFMELLPSQIMMIVFLSMVFVVSSFAGLILGEWISGILTMFGFWVSLPSFINSIPFSFLSKDRSVITREYYTYYFDYSRYIQTNKSTFSDIGLAVSLCVIVSILFYLWGQKLFSEISLEKNGSYLMFDGLRKATQWLFVIYVFFVFSASSVFEVLEIKITGKNPYTDYEPNLIRILITAFIMAVISYVIAHGVIYRSIPFKFRKKEVELSYK